MYVPMYVYMYAHSGICGLRFQAPSGISKRVRSALAVASAPPAARGSYCPAACSNREQTGSCECLCCSFRCTPHKLSFVFFASD